MILVKPPKFESKQVRRLILIRAFDIDRHEIDDCFHQCSGMVAKHDLSFILDELLQFPVHIMVR